MRNLKNLLLAAPFVFLLLAPTVLAKDNFWRGALGIHGRGGCANASWHAMKDDDHHLVYPDCILGATATPTGTPEASETPEPSETPEGTPTATPTESPTATPTGTPEGTATPTPEATPTGTPEATPTESPIGITAQSGTSLQDLLRELIEALKNLIQDED